MPGHGRQQDGRAAVSHVGGVLLAAARRRVRWLGTLHIVRAAPSRRTPRGAELAMGGNIHFFLSAPTGVCSIHNH